MSKRVITAKADPITGEPVYEAGYLPEAGEEAAAAALPNEVLTGQDVPQDPNTIDPSHPAEGGEVIPEGETLPAVDLPTGDAPLDLIAEADQEAAAALAALRAGETPGMEHGGVDYMARPDLIPTDEQVGLALTLAAINEPAKGARPVKRIGPPPDGGEPPKRPFDFATYYEIFDRAAPLEMIKTPGKLFFVDGAGNVYYLDEVHSGEFVLRLRMYAPPAE